MAKGQDVTFDVNARDKTKRGLLSAQKNLKKTGKEADRLAGRFRSVARATVIMEGPLGGTAGRLSAMATMLNSVNAGAIAFGIGMTAMTAVAYQSMRAFSDWEVQTLKINKLIEQTGGAAGLAASEIEEMSIRIGKATLSSTGDVRSASAILLTFKSIAVDAFERTLDVASDLAALTGQELKQSVIQLGKALENPATGMSALRRVGVSFTDSQKETIVAMNEVGNVAGAQSKILELLEGQLGGAGAAAGGGLAGAVDMVTENWNLLLISLAKTGGGDVATKMLDNVAISLDKIGKHLDPSLQDRRSAANEKAWAARIKLGKAIKEESKAVENNTWFYKSNVKSLRKVVELRNSELKAIDAEIAAKDAAVAAARRKGEAAQKEIQITKELAATKKLADAERKNAESEFKKDDKASSAYAQKLVDEEEKFRTSLMNKSLQEDVYLDERITKIREDLASKLLNKEEAYAAEQAAYSLHEGKLTEINETEEEKRLEKRREIQQINLTGTATALGDIATMMASSSEDNFKIGKKAAIAQSLVNGYSAAVAAWESGMEASGPWTAAAFAAASLIKTTAQIQQIKSQKFSAAREHGGSVLAGRSYLVGERGPELFTAPRTGQIINNSTTNAVGGSSLTVNNYNTFESDESFIQRNAAKIVNVVTEKMNEEGWSFA